MPYSAPSSPPAHPLHARRVRSASTDFSNESGLGTFTSLGPLPHLKIPGGPSLARRTSIFHFQEDTEDCSNSISDDSDCHSDDKGTNSKPPPSQNQLKSVTRPLSPSQKLSCAAQPSAIAIPFPNTSPSSSGPLLSVVPRRYTTPLLPATTVSPIHHPNGKPLKSSLKSSSFIPSIPGSRRSRTKQSRSRSAPPMHPKNVHFAETECGLETITLFSKFARPASLGRPGGDVAESEIDTDCRQPIRASPYLTFTRSCLPALSPPAVSTPAQLLELDYTTPGATSTIPSISPTPHSNVFLESLALSSQRATSTLTGTVVVRNLAYEKQVAVRFTLDEWQTTSEVSAHYLVPLLALPHAIHPGTVGNAIPIISTSPEGKDSTALLWDRFSFTILLNDTYNLHDRVLWIAVRFSGSGGEWWDNNSGKNYRVGFRVMSDSTGAGTRRKVTSAPTAPIS